MTKKMLLEAEIYKPDVEYPGRGRKPLSIFVEELQKVLKEYPAAVILYWQDGDSGIKVVADREETNAEYDLRLLQEAQRREYEERHKKEREQREYADYLRLKAKYEKQDEPSH